MGRNAADYAARVERNLAGLQFVSTGPSPGCDDCAAAHGMEAAEFRAAWERGEICAEGSFSWDGCGVCDNPHGATLEEWHAIDSNGDMLHFEDACPDCVAYLANGTLPGEDD